MLSAMDDIDPRIAEALIAQEAVERLLRHCAQVVARQLEQQADELIAKAEGLRSW